jgi:hypothetical protein
MGNILYIIAVILVIIWAIGFFGYAAGGLIHILLVIAVISIILQLFVGEVHSKTDNRKLKRTTV